MRAVKAYSVLLWAPGLPLVNDMTHLWDMRACRRWWRPADRSQHSSLAFTVNSPVQMPVPHIHMGINHGFISLLYSCCRELHPVVTLIYPALSQLYTVSTQTATRQGADLWFHGYIHHVKNTKCQHCWFLMCYSMCSLLFHSSSCISYLQNFESIHMYGILKSCAFLKFSDIYFSLKAHIKFWIKVSV